MGAICYVARREHCRWWGAAKLETTQPTVCMYTVLYVVPYLFMITQPTVPERTTYTPSYGTQVPVPVSTKQTANQAK